jgi:hypothetical protein
MSAFGRARFPRAALKMGVVVGLTQYKGAVAVLFDGNTTSTSIHRRYIEPSEAEKLTRSCTIP